MKKLTLALGLILCTCSFLSAEPNIEKLSESLKQAVARDALMRKQKAPKNHGAINQPITVHFLIEDYLAEYFPMLEDDGSYEHNVFTADVFCKAYALDEHWLMVAKECIIPPTDTYQRGPEDPSYLRERVSNTIQDYQDAKQFENRRLILIQAPKENFHAPYVRVFAAHHPTTLTSVSPDGEVMVSTSRFAVVKDKIRYRTIDPKSIKDQIFSLDESKTDLSALATDPLFVTDGQRNEYLAAYNRGKVTYSLQIDQSHIFETSELHGSNTWEPLHLEDLRFIQSVIAEEDPQAWEQIKLRLFFNSFDKPYFK